MSTPEIKYSDLVCTWLQELGYTHCFFVAGGQVMHLLESVSRHFTCIPVVHEVATGIAAEYFTESGLQGKAFALVTAGPGLTNLVTAIGGAFLESRELLILGGQVKRADLAGPTLRQRGIQEIDGVSIVKPICKHAARLDAPWSQNQIRAAVEDGARGKKGPVFLEFPLDIQAMKVVPAVPDAPNVAPITVNPMQNASTADVQKIAAALRNAERPVLLLGGGIERATSNKLQSRLATFGIPLATTWNGADRVAASNPYYIGRPNTFGQRAANLLIQQADVVVALGTRLGLQQTGFNWQNFVPNGQIIQVDIDAAELAKGHPKTSLSFAVDANALLEALVLEDVGRHQSWLDYCNDVRGMLPLVDAANVTGPGFVSPHEFITWLSSRCTADDVIVPCSSGSAFTIMMQCFQQKAGQLMISNKGSASMGYGLSGAIGLAAAANGRRTILVEGDGGFAQNIQEIGTAALNNLPIKIFIFDDHGYASIRMTQRNYFGGRYVGCDIETGLGMPNWERLFAAYDVPSYRLDPQYQESAEFAALMNAPGPAAFFVPVDPEQTYFPKITSRVLADGTMESNPLDQMTPPLDEETYRKTARYLQTGTALV